MIPGFCRPVRRAWCAARARADPGWGAREGKGCPSRGPVLNCGYPVRLPRRARAGLGVGLPGAEAGPASELWTDCGPVAMVRQSAPRSLRACAPGLPSVGCPLSVMGRDCQVARTWSRFLLTLGLACLTWRTDTVRRPACSVSRLAWSSCDPDRGRRAAAPVEGWGRRTSREPAAGVMDRRGGQSSDADSRSLRTAGLALQLPGRATPLLPGCWSGERVLGGTPKGHEGGGDNGVTKTNRWRRVGPNCRDRTDSHWP